MGIWLGGENTTWGISILYQSAWVQVLDPLQFQLPANMYHGS